MALSEKQNSSISAGGWQFGTLLTTDHVWDAFIILTLLDLHKRNDTCCAMAQGKSVFRFGAQTNVNEFRHFVGTQLN
jgi:hypothetical protein